MFCRPKDEESLLASLDERLLLLSFEWPEFMVAPGSTRLSPSEIERLSTFSCRRAKCFKPIDRATVLSAIRHEWGSEAHFDAWVQTQLPKILKRSKELYSRQMLNVAGKALERVLAD